MQTRPDAAKIKRWREERFWSQEHLAELAGLGLRTVQRIENGDPASKESVMALAAAFNVDVIALTVNEQTEAAQQREKKAKKSLAALRLGFLINLACWVFGMIVFAGISLSDSDGHYEMFAPSIWWTVGLAGFGLAVVIVELVTRFQPEEDGAS
ncbi:MAG: helix-turn-helix domain-containing protein [Hyphomonadaceae bacterium]|nr:helix-turn-helix domain-containing protein [Hyphomonadaceae bacterium]